jgi:HPt (histidine-containing phosphotransfer) domain-containing protein
MLAGDDSDGAVQLAHKLRGIARNLGAYALGDCAEAIELPLKSGATLAADALPQLEQAILQTRESQAALLPAASADGTGGELDAAQRKEIFSALSQAVAENNPEAAELVEQLIAGMNEGDAGYDELVAVSEALDMYDFATAGGSLERALSLLA